MIAAVAIVASAIIAILTTTANLIFSYRTNMQNIKARHADIVTEKSIEAHRELVEKLRGSIRVFGKNREKLENCVSTLAKYELYLPETISNGYFKVISQLATTSQELPDDTTMIEKGNFPDFDMTVVGALEIIAVCRNR